MLIGEFATNDNSQLNLVIIRGPWYSKGSIMDSIADGFYRKSEIPAF